MSSSLTCSVTVSGWALLICYNITKPDKARNNFISAPIEAAVSTKKNMDLFLQAAVLKSSHSTRPPALIVSPCNCPATFSSFHLSSSALGEREGWRLRRQQQMLGGCVNVNVLT